MRIYLCVDTYGGEDPIEAEVELPFVPRIGDTIEMWDQGAPETLGYAQTDHFPVVDCVVLSVYMPEYVRVFLRFDCFDLDTVRRVMATAAAGVTP